MDDMKFLMELLVGGGLAVAALAPDLGTSSGRGGAGGVANAVTAVSSEDTNSSDRRSGVSEHYERALREADERAERAREEAEEVRREARRRHDRLEYEMRKARWDAESDARRNNEEIQRRKDQEQTYREALADAERTKRAQAQADAENDRNYREMQARRATPETQTVYGPGWTSAPGPSTASQAPHGSSGGGAARGLPPRR